MKFRWLIAFFLAFLAIPMIARGDDDDIRRLMLLYTNDMHGGIVPQKAEFLNPEFPPLLGGGASAARIIDEVRDRAEAKNDAHLLVDSGDIFQGTLVGTKSGGLAIVEYMNMVGYDAVAVGNHEFDLGKENFIELVKAAEFPWLACNIYDETTGERWEWVQPWVIIERAGLKIGVVGVATVGTEAMSFPEHVAGLDFRNEILELQKAVEEVRGAGAELVVALSHKGLAYNPREGYAELKERTREEAIREGGVSGMELAHYVTGIDVMLGGHIHRGYDQPWVDPRTHTICVQNYGNGGNLGWLNVDVHMPTHSVAGYSTPSADGSLLLLQQDQFWPDSTVLAYLREQQDKYEAGFREVIGRLATPLNRSSIGEGTMNNFITDVMVSAAQTDFAFVNFGGLRADLRAGPVTREDIFKVLPFGNEIVVFQCNGRFLKRIVETKLFGGRRGIAIGGGTVVFNKDMPNGERVVEMTVGGEPLNPDRIYRVATNDYLMEGNSGLDLLTDIPRDRVNPTGIRIGDAVMAYIQENSPVSATVDGRWKRDDDARPTDEWRSTFAPAMP